MNKKSGWVALSLGAVLGSHACTGADPGGDAMGTSTTVAASTTVTSSGAPTTNPGSAGNPTGDATATTAGAPTTDASATAADSSGDATTVGTTTSGLDGLDAIPEDLTTWDEQGVVLSTDPAIAWEEQNQIAVIGAALVDGTYFLYYLAGFDGCWDTDGDSNHQSVGVATSRDGVNFDKHAGNPILRPHDFLPVESEEEGIRTAYIRYLPTQDRFFGYFGVESPAGGGGCTFGGGGGCACDIGVDAAVYAADSGNGLDWAVQGEVGGTYAAAGNEVYASGWVLDGSDFQLYVTTAEGGQDKAFSRGSDPLQLNELGGVPALSFGWSGVDAYLHNDGETVTLIYEPDGGSHPGSATDDLYFATVQLSDPTVLIDERVVSDSGDERNIIFRDGKQWRWYYSDEADEYNNQIRLRTHAVVD